MASLIKPYRTIGQRRVLPTGRPVLNTQHPLASFLIGAWLPGLAGGRNLGTYPLADMTIQSAAKFNMLPEGPALDSTDPGGNCGMFLTIGTGTPFTTWQNNALSFYWRGQLAGANIPASSYNSMVWGIDYSNPESAPYEVAGIINVSPNSLYMTGNNGGGNYNAGPVTLSPPSIMTSYAGSAQINGSAYLYINGANVASAGYGSSSQPAASSTTALVLSTYIAHTAGSADVITTCHYIFNKQLSDAEQFALDQDPYGMFLPANDPDLAAVYLSGPTTLALTARSSSLSRSSPTIGGKVALSAATRIRSSDKGLLYRVVKFSAATGIQARATDAIKARAALTAQSKIGTTAQPLMTVAAQGQVTLTGVAAAGAVAPVTASSSSSASLAGVAGTGVVAAVTTSASGGVLLIGVAGAGVASPVTASSTASTTLNGVAGNGSIASVADGSALSPNAVASTGAVAALSVSDVAVSNSVTALATAASISSSDGTSLNGVSGSGAAGTVSAGGGASAVLSAVSALGTVSAPSILIARPIMSVTAAGVVATIGAIGTEIVMGVAALGSASGLIETIARAFSPVAANGNVAAPSISTSSGSNVALTTVAGSGAAAQLSAGPVTALFSAAGSGVVLILAGTSSSSASVASAGAVASLVAASNDNLPSVACSAFVVGVALPRGAGLSAVAATAAANSPLSVANDNFSAVSAAGSAFPIARQTGSGLPPVTSIGAVNAPAPVGGIVVIPLDAARVTLVLSGPLAVSLSVTGPQNVSLLVADPQSVNLALASTAIALAMPPQITVDLSVAA